MAPRNWKRAPEPAAVGLKPVNVWSRGSGPWSLFPVRIGTPAQTVHLLPSTSHHAYWTVIPDNCEAGQDCSAAEYSQFNGSMSTSIMSGVQLPKLPLKAEGPLGYTGTGTYSWDNSFLGAEGSGGPQLRQQGVTMFNQKSLFPGLLGLTLENTTALGTIVNSALFTLKLNNYIPSYTYGYTAGSYARGVQGSLTLGGYDANRIQDPTKNATFTMADDPNRSLFAVLTQLNIGGMSAMGLDPLNLFVDSTVQELWLPQDVCTNLVNKYNLTHDPVQDVYTNPSDPAQRPSNQAISFIFTGNNGDVNITMPFASLDLWDNTSGQNLTIFPLKTAANSSQLTLGRSFLQDAYLVTDYERRIFQLAQAKDDSPDSTNLITIQPPSGSTGGSNSGLSTGAIAGIAVGSVVGALIALGLVLYFFFLRPRKRKAASNARKESHVSDQQTLVEADGPDKPVESPGSTPATELPTKTHIPQLPDNKRQVHEMFQLPVEMEGDSVPRDLKKPVS